jgi:hypothetical protein
VPTPRVNSCTPAPLKVTVCGLQVALSLIVSVPVRCPMAVGVKMIETWHVAFTASVPPQVFVCEKSPLAAIPEMLRTAVPVLVRVIA